MGTDRFPGRRFHTALNGRVSWYCVPEHSAAAGAVGAPPPPALRTAAESVIKWWDAAPPTFPEGEYVGPAIEGLRAAIEAGATKENPDGSTEATERPDLRAALDAAEDGTVPVGARLSALRAAVRAALTGASPSPSRHAAWCSLPVDHAGLCEGDQ